MGQGQRGSASERTANVGGLLGLALALACGCGSRTVPEAGRPNVLLVVVDTLRADRLGCYGAELDTSPRLDALAARSTVFTRAYATAPWTLPATGSLMSGQHPRVLGSLRERVQIPAEFTLLAERFQAAGYRTGAVVSHVFVDREHGFGQGFDDFDEAESGRGHAHVSSPGVTTSALGWLAEHAGGPFFLFVHYFDPHYDYRMHAELDTFPDYEGPLLDPPETWGLRKRAAQGGLSDADWRYLRACYDSEVRFTDRHLGELLDGLEAHGVGEDTIVVFTADHGEELGEAPDRWIGHTRKLSERILRVPLVIHVPGRAPGRVDAPVSGVDVMPTIAALAGLPVPAPTEVAGRPLRWEDPAWRPGPVFAETQRDARVQALVLWPWKLERDLTTGEARLFDLAGDPLGERDLAAAHPEEVERLLGELELVLEGQERLAERSQARLVRPALSVEDEEALRALGYNE